MVQRESTGSELADSSTNPEGSARLRATFQATAATPLILVRGTLVAPETNKQEGCGWNGGEG